MKIEHKVVPVIQTKVLDEAQGIVGAFVSVTGVVDSVKDRIIPGAYQSTLAQRTPKGVWSHDWDTPVSKTLKAEELLPGDDRLPKKTRNGDDWPTAAGALYVETQFNLGTQRGKDAFSDVVFFGDEQEWSIGYNVPPGTAKFDAKTGVRELSYVDLFEYSPVLFGAMDLTTTAGVKDAQEAFRQAAAAGTAAVDQVTVEEREEKDAEAPVAQGDAPAADPVASGFVDASQATVSTPQDPQYILTPDPAAVPAGSGTNVGVALEPRAAAQVVGTTEEPKGIVSVNDDGSFKITLAKDADEETVQGLAEVMLAKHRREKLVEDPKTAGSRYMALLNPAGDQAMAELKAWFGEEMAKPGHDAVALTAEMTKRERAVFADPTYADVWEVPDKDVPVRADGESKAQVVLTGSYEERQDAVRKVLPTALDGLVDLSETDEYGYATTFVATEATFPNKVVAAVYDMKTYDVRYFEAGYTFGTDGATMKPAREVRVEAAVVAKGQARVAEFKAAYDRLRGVQGFPGERPQPVVSVTVGAGADAAAVKAAIEAAVADAVAETVETVNDNHTDNTKTLNAAAGDEMVTLTDMDLAMLDRLRLDL